MGRGGGSAGAGGVARALTPARPRAVRGDSVAGRAAVASGRRVWGVMVAKAAAVDEILKISKNLAGRVSF